MRLLRSLGRGLLIALAALGFRGWIARPSQFTIRGYGVLVASAAAVLIVARFPGPMIGFVAGFGLVIIGLRALPRHGFRSADVAVCWAIALVAAMLLLPEMVRVRERTAGGRFFPRVVPARFMALVRGEQIQQPF